MASDSSILRNRVAGLFRYLAELIALRSKKIRDVESYEECLWISNVPRERECFTPAWNAKPASDDEPWLRIDKPVHTKCPVPPAACANWFVPESLTDPKVEPALLQQIVAPREADVPDDSQPSVLYLHDYPNVAEAWNHYIEREWRAWKVEQDRYLKVYTVYETLFGMSQQLKRKGEQFELLLGVGTLTWLDSKNQRICHPIVTARVAFDETSSSGSLVIVPSPEGANFQLEQDMLEVEDRPSNDVQEFTEKSVAGLDSPWNQPQLFPVLKDWLNKLKADSVFDASLERAAKATNAPQLAFAPLLLLRRRGERRLQHALRSIADQALGDGEIPIAMAEICLGKGGGQASPVDDSLGKASCGMQSEALFPLPSNEEQLKIIRQLAGRSGVLVQGPPGTGKSHTIVNLICHFLAEGKRILVTAQTPQALKVLREKIPEEIRPLTVSLLGEDEQSRRALEQSVNGILKQQRDADLASINEQIDRTAQERHLLQSQLASLRGRMRELREIETATFHLPGGRYSGSAQQIAKAVADDAATFGWLRDAVAEDLESPLSTDALLKLCELCDEFGEGAAEAASQELPDPAKLPSAEELKALIAAFWSARRRVEGLGASIQRPEVQSLESISASALENLRAVAIDFGRLRDQIESRDWNWIATAWIDLRAKRNDAWDTLLQATQAGLNRLGAATEADDFELWNPPPSVDWDQLLADTEDLAGHLESGRGLGIPLFRPRAVAQCRYLWTRYRFRGRLCNTLKVLRELAMILRRRQTLRDTWRLWEPHAHCPAGSFRHSLNLLRQHASALESVIGMSRLTIRAREQLGGVEGYSGHFDEPDWSENVLSSIEDALSLRTSRDAATAMRECVERIKAATTASGSHSIAAQLQTAGMKGNVAHYSQALAELDLIRAQRDKARLFLESLAQLSAIAPQLATELLDSERRETLRTRLPNFQSAWQRRRAIAWLDRFDREHQIDSLRTELASCDAMLARATTRQASLQAWRGCLLELQERPMIGSALVAWEQTVRRIGKGTGKNAETLRRQAREYMQQCRAAIPAWIMPLHRVAEQIQIEPEAFDVVIVDEASQMGPQGLVLQFLARQCIVVGDDRQISPDGGFIDADAVQSLMAKHLIDIPFKDTLLPTSSLFHQAAIRYGSRITLREHFRCMPEIIQFSNSLSYADTPLIPLRQYPPDRIPPIVVRYVVGGYREGTSENALNRPEAAAIVDAVKQCLADAKYDGKSMGVICLQGQAQARHIESELQRLVGTEPFQDPERRLLCGDPYSFQGDERDVIFLSMVAAVDGATRLTAFTKEMYQQRYNVAASRARDQMWVFHSVRESDLNPQCMRRRLLEFCYHGPRVVETCDISLCESEFEREVATELINRRYRVVPQYKVAGKRIDLVVEDGSSRVALECDGDRWHGPDEYDADMARQRMLERCGWRFIRVRGSLFYANRERAIQTLLAQIAAHGIQPVVGEFDPKSADIRSIGEVQGDECLQRLGPGAHEVRKQSGVAFEGLEESEDESVELDIVQVLQAEHALVRPTDGSPANGQAVASEPKPSPSTAPEKSTELSAQDFLEIISVPSEIWFQISRWAKENSQLESWQRSVAYSLGRCKRSDITPSINQIVQGRRILTEALSQGFVPPQKR